MKDKVHSVARVCTVWVLGGMGMVFFLGCVSTGERDRPFSDAWAAQQRSEREFQERRKRIRGEEGITLFGDPARKRAAVRMDEQGKPKLDIGGDTGLSVDLNYGGRTEAQVKYKLQWGHGRTGGCGSGRAVRGNRSTARDARSKA